MEKFYEAVDQAIEHHYYFNNINSVKELVPHYDELGDVKKLIYLFQALSRVESDDPNNWQNLVDLLILDQQYEKALTTLKEASAAIPAFSSRAYTQSLQIKDLIKQRDENENTN